MQLCLLLKGTRSPPDFQSPVDGHARRAAGAVAVASYGVSRRGPATGARSGLCARTQSLLRVVTVYPWSARLPRPDRASSVQACALLFLHCCKRAPVLCPWAGCARRADLCCVCWTARIRVGVAKQRLCAVTLRRDGCLCSVAWVRIWGNATQIEPNLPPRVDFRRVLAVTRGDPPASDSGLRAGLRRRWSGGLLGLPVWCVWPMSSHARL
jgi:hypothetical protein